jgi:hypothetical protein
MDGKELLGSGKLPTDFERWIKARLEERSDLSLEGIWTRCAEGRWLLWLATWAGVDRRRITAAVCAAVEPAIIKTHGDVRPGKAIKTVRRWMFGAASIDDVRAATLEAEAAERAAEKLLFDNRYSRCVEHYESKQNAAIAVSSVTRLVTAQDRRDAADCAGAAALYAERALRRFHTVHVVHDWITLQDVAAAFGNR